jgi:hypothetical protein
MMQFRSSIPDWVETDEQLQEYANRLVHLVYGDLYNVEEGWAYDGIVGPRTISPPDFVFYLAIVGPKGVRIWETGPHHEDRLWDEYESLVARLKDELTPEEIKEFDKET